MKTRAELEAENQRWLREAMERRGIVPSAERKAEELKRIRAELHVALPATPVTDGNFHRGHRRFTT